jgi:hypothetical protein
MLTVVHWNGESGSVRSVIAAKGWTQTNQQRPVGGAVSVQGFQKV